MNSGVSILSKMLRCSSMRKSNIIWSALLLILFLFFVNIVVLKTTSEAHAATSSTTTSLLQEQINVRTTEVVQLNQEIAKYQAEIQQTGADKKTLQAAINVLNLQRKKLETQILATQNQIATVKLEITQLNSNISGTQSSIEEDQAALAEDVRSLSAADEQSLILQILSADSLAEVWSDVDATLQVQTAIQNQVQVLITKEEQLAAAQTASKEKQAVLSSQKQNLAGEQVALTQTQLQKTRLLIETNAKESNYEKLLSRAKAELEGFSTFAKNAGGFGLLSNQTSCDSWGCYYNQRDSAWGDDPLDGTQYSLKSDGCLVTAMAMVMTHYGYRNVTPVTINTNPGNFASYYPAYLLFTIHVDGVSATRKAATINATLSTGNPVIVGLYAYGGTHFVVLTKKIGNDYLMRDPYIPNGKDISFSAHYSLRNIFGISRVIIN